MDEMQQLLEGMRDDFLSELPERCGHCERLILKLTTADADADTFQELCREVHSLKGLGGTFGLPSITTICHELEHHLERWHDPQAPKKAWADCTLAHIDLLRQTARSPAIPPSELAAALAQLRQAQPAAIRFRCLIIEPSRTMTQMYQSAVAELAIDLSVQHDSLEALTWLMSKPFDLVLMGGQLKELNAETVITAMRAPGSVNQDTPVILITSNLDTIKRDLFDYVVHRNHHLLDTLVGLIKKTLLIQK